jgi:cobalt/nickel transport system permease protein
MDEHLLDDLALNNGLREENSRLKLLLGIGAILICVFSPSPVTPLIIAASMALIIVGLAKIPPKEFARLLFIPVAFAATSCIVILFLTGGGDPLYAVSVGGFTFTATTASVNLSILLLARTFGAMSALFFIALSTPIIQVFAVMKDLRLPQEFIDLSMLIYRLIFIFIGEAIAIHNAQVMRNGYAGFRKSIDALAMLCGSLFIRAWGRGEEMLIAMDARCYDGKFETGAGERLVSPRAAAAVGSFLAGCIVLSFLFAEVVLFS